MTSRFDDEVLLLRPVDDSVNGAAIEQHLTETPGAFRDPHDLSTWILAGHPEFIAELRQKRIENASRYLPDPRVIVSPDAVVVVPGVSGRGRKFVHWLLARGPCDLTVRGEAVGRVTSPSDIYTEEEWDDPDAHLDPTETPPRTGTLISIERDSVDLSEDLAVHDSGIMSYEQRRPIEDPEKTYRRMAPEILSRWSALIEGLPPSGDAPGPDGDYVDPVIVKLYIPTDLVSAMKIDAARPTEPCREFISLVTGWIVSLREDRAAIPPGLLPFP